MLEKTRKKKLKKINRKVEESAIDIIEESIHILRMNAFRLLPVYFLGSFPFAVALLFFINDMSLAKPLEHEIVNAVIIVTALFAWKNLMQSIFCLRVMNVLNFREDQKLGVKRLFRIFLYQNIVQPVGLVMQTFSLFLFLPLPWTTAFFNTFAVLAAMDDETFMKSFKTSVKLTLTKPLQSNLMLFIFFFFSLMVMLNTVFFILFVPQLIKTFLGIETIITATKDIILALKTIFNTTFWSVVLVCVWLCVDPIIKTAYTVRTFYGESVTKGYDVLAALARLSKGTVKSVLPFLLFFVFALGGYAGNTPENPQNHTAKPPELKKAIEKTLNSREYKWRLPRPENDDATEKSNFLAEWLTQFFKGLSEKLQAFLKWIADLLPESKNPEDGMSRWSGLNISPIAMFIGIFVVILVIAFSAYFIVRHRRKTRKIILAGKPPDKIPDLTREDITADQLEESGWMKLAAQLIEEGKLRLAVRALFLAILSSLSEQHVVTIARFKTNREYLYELRRRAHSQKQLIEKFDDSLGIFEVVWYGDYEVTPNMLDKVRSNYRQISGVGRNE